ncbi:hypothetical protein [Sphingomonas hylomeconis]|uniref:Uncharacterized protein n=1 Tax=Sphingomonas hylomeconis TaxID=1395958 RepID=A0ABV7SWD2_9SPHN|nr:hypothetical protein [Sphingomonas hylomeconis]
MAKANVRVRGRRFEIDLHAQISPAGLLAVAAIVLAAAVVTGVAIREARRPVPARRLRDAGEPQR